MIKNFSKLVKLAVVTASVMVAPAGFAATSWTLNLDTGCPAGQGTLGSTINCTGSGVTAAMTGWTTNGTIASSTIQTSILKDWGTNGYGVQSGVEGDSQHSMDNANATDMILLNFGSDVVLDRVKIGWKGTDSDISLLAYVGDDGASNSTAIAGKTLGGLGSAGWKMVSDYSDLVVGTDKAVNPPTAPTNKPVASSWWLVSSYNSNFGGGNTWTAGNDFVKLLQVSGMTVDSTTKVPEPGSLALMGVALMGFMAVRRRSQK